MTETRFYEPARQGTQPKPLFSLKPLDATTWLRSLLSKVFLVKYSVFLRRSLVDLQSVNEYRLLFIQNISPILIG